MADLETAYAVLKARMDRGGLTVPEAQVAYWRQRLASAVQELARMGIHVTAATSDSVLLADYTAWKLQNRDKPDGMPRWLRLELRERWISQERGEDATD